VRGVDPVEKTGTVLNNPMEEAMKRGSGTGKKRGKYRSSIAKKNDAQLVRQVLGDTAQRNPGDLLFRLAIDAFERLFPSGAGGDSGEG